MKRLLSISALVLVFAFSCESWVRRQKSQKAEPGLSASDLFREQSRKPITTPAAQPVPVPPPTRTVRAVPAPTASDMVAVRDAGSSVVSRAYPWPECGIVRLDKTMPNEVGLNRSFRYTINLTNLTETTLPDIIVTEELPGHFRFMSAVPTAREDGNKLVWEIASLGPKATRQFTVSGMATYIDSLKHCTTVVTPVIPACASVLVIQPELRLTKTAPAEVLLCDLIPVRFMVSNAGTGSVQNVKIMETLPAGLRTTDGKGELVFDAGTLMAGQSRQFSAELRATQTGRYVGKAAASSTTGLSVESAPTTTTVGMPVLSISKTGPDQQYIGRPIAYEVTVTNKSDVSAKNTVLEETIPDGVDSVKATAGGKLAGSKIIWEFGTLEPTASREVRISYIPTKAGILANTASATAYCATAVNASMRTSVTGICALLMEVVDVEDPVRVGSYATYVIRVENQGSAAATNIRIAAVLEDNVRYISSAGATARAEEGRTVRFFPLGTLAPKAKAAWRVVVQAERPGDVRFKIIMQADQLTRPVEETESTHLYE
ncbi:MAG: hypothetical protein ACYTEK_28055 [Planctomycetota bacterium]|jgi:uncharacterized repeat protein (TIGR01451 family)